MTVRELIEYLKGCNPGLPVILASDLNGATFSPLRVVGGGPDDPCSYEAEDNECGTVYTEAEVEATRDEGWYNEWVLEPVVCLWPKK